MLSAKHGTFEAKMHARRLSLKLAHRRTVRVGSLKASPGGAMQKKEILFLAGPQKVRVTSVDILGAFKVT